MYVRSPLVLLAALVGFFNSQTIDFYVFQIELDSQNTRQTIMIIAIKIIVIMRLPVHSYAGQAES